eukprot:scaffold336_cov250-Pinguiococcus_pyrenoidosus.AAC.12
MMRWQGAARRLADLDLLDVGWDSGFHAKGHHRGIAVDVHDDLSGEVDHLLREGRGEEQGLDRVRQSLRDLQRVLAMAILVVHHLVRLVQHEDLQVARIELAALQLVGHRRRRANHDMLRDSAGLHRGYEDGDLQPLNVPRHGRHALLPDLIGNLAGRHHTQALRRGQHDIHSVKHAQHKADGLAGATGGLDDDAPRRLSQDLRQLLALDAEGRVELAFLLDSPEDGFGQGQLPKAADSAGRPTPAMRRLGADSPSEAFRPSLLLGSLAFLRSSEALSLPISHPFGLEVDMRLRARGSVRTTIFSPLGRVSPWRRGVDGGRIMLHLHLLEALNELRFILRLRRRLLRQRSGLLLLVLHRCVLRVDVLRGFRNRSTKQFGVPSSADRSAQSTARQNLPPSGSSSKGGSERKRQPQRAPKRGVWRWNLSSHTRGVAPRRDTAQRAFKCDGWIAPKPFARLAVGSQPLRVH